MPLSSVYTWTDSTVVLSWLAGDPRRFKTYVGNRVIRIAKLIPSDRWNHVSGFDNPADCASRGLFPLGTTCGGAVHAGSSLNLLVGHSRAHLKLPVFLMRNVRFARSSEIQ